MQKKTILKALLILSFFSTSSFSSTPVTPQVMGNVVQSVTSPSSSPSAQASSQVGSIFSVPLDIVQKALDDASALVLTTDSDSSVVCAVNTNNNYAIGKTIIVDGKPACQTINPNSGMGVQGLLVRDNILGIISSKSFNWKEGSKSNPDEWYTLSGQIAVADPNNPVVGICGIKSETIKPKEIGIAVRRNDQPHSCIFSNRSVPISDPSILVLVK